MTAYLQLLLARQPYNDGFGLSLKVGVSVMITALVVFAVVAAQATSGGPLTLLDIRIANFLHGEASPGTVNVALLFTHLHGVPAVSCWASILGFYLLRRRQWYWLYTTLLAVPGVMLLNVALKYTFQRARPSFEEPFLMLSNYSFPSGHTAASTVFYGVLAIYLCTRNCRNAMRAVIILIAATMITLVAMSRLYLGAHYFSDVVAAVAEGSAWLALVLMIITQHRRSIDPDAEGGTNLQR